MKNDYKEEWRRPINFQDEDEGITFKEFAIGLLFCAGCIAAGVAALWIRSIYYVR